MAYRSKPSFNAKVLVLLCLWDDNGSVVFFFFYLSNNWLQFEIGDKPYVYLSTTWVTNLVSAVPDLSCIRAPAYCLLAAAWAAIYDYGSTTRYIALRSALFSGHEYLIGSKAVDVWLSILVHAHHSSADFVRLHGDMPQALPVNLWGRCKNTTWCCNIAVNILPKFCAIKSATKK